MLIKLLKKYINKKNIEKKHHTFDDKTKGEKGEKFAALTLELKGFRILGRNLRFGKKEIDILALKDNELFIFETKMRTGNDFGSALESINKNKKTTLIKLSQKFNLNKYKNIYVKLFAIDIINKRKLTYNIVDIIDELNK